MRRMKNIHALLTQLDIFTTTLGGSKFVTISIALPVMKSIMKEMVAKEDDPNYICEMKAVMITDFKERVKDLLDLGFLMKTVALDPRFKNIKVVENKNRKEAVFRELEGEMGEHVKDQ